MTTTELRERGWTIPDGLAPGDILGCINSVPIRNDARRNTLDGVSRECLRDACWNHSDLLALGCHLTADDQDAQRVALASIGVVPPEEWW